LLAKREKGVFSSQRKNLTTISKTINEKGFVTLPKESSVYYGEKGVSKEGLSTVKGKRTRLQ